ncbi:MAG: extracellular solute-binding protein [Nitriliruptoraceae bacterium]
MVRARRPGRRQLAVLLVGATLLTACGSASAGETVRVYSGRHYDLEPAFEAFATETGISVEFLHGGDAELRERIVAEGENTQADVFLTVDAGNLALAAEAGAFQPLVVDEVTEAIPDHLRHPDDLWVGLAVRARTIAYDPRVVDPSELSTYEALADPEWHGRLCLRRSVDTYTQSLVASLVAAHGEERTREILDGWVANARIFNNDIAILENIASGDCGVGIVNHYYLARLIAEDPDFPVDLFWANQDGRGVHVNLSGAGVTRHADNPDAARALIAWLATDGQREFVGDNYEYPANPDAPVPELLDRFGTFRADETNANELGSFNRVAVELLTEAGYR